MIHFDLAPEESPRTNSINPTKSHRTERFHIKGPKNMWESIKIKFLGWKFPGWRSTWWLIQFAQGSIPELVKQSGFSKKDSCRWKLIEAVRNVFICLVNRIQAEENACSPLGGLIKNTEILVQENAFLLAQTTKHWIWFQESEPKKRKE